MRKMWEDNPPDQEVPSSESEKPAPKEEQEESEKSEESEESEAEVTIEELTQKSLSPVEESSEEESQDIGAIDGDKPDLDNSGEIPSAQVNLDNERNRVKGSSFFG